MVRGVLGFGGCSSIGERDGILLRRGCVHEVATSDDLIELEMAPSSGAEVERIVAKAVFLPSFMASTKVELRLRADGRVEVWDYRPDEPAPETPIGYVPSRESARTVELIKVGASVNQPCVCAAAVFRARRGAWQLLLHRPLKLVESG